MADYYMTGSVLLTAGSKAIVGVDTAWQIAQVAGGTIFVEGEGNALPLASIESDTAATAALEWTGATGTYNYALLRATAFSEQLETNSNIMSRLLIAMEAGTLYRYDVAGDAADLTSYDERPKGFAYLATDVNPAELYIKASAASGDWRGPFSYGQGQEGDPGPPGPVSHIEFAPIETGPAGSDATMVVTGSGTVEDPLVVAITVPRGNPGADGTGTGDVVGPSGAVDGNLAAYGGSTGKLLVDTGRKAADLVAGPAASVNNRVAIFDGATGKAIKDSGVVLGGAAGLNVGTTAGTVAAGDDARFSQGGSSQNEAILALAIADLQGSRLGMKGGVADAFDDETGVDTVASSNAVYDAANDWYRPVVTSTAIASISLSTDNAAQAGVTWRTVVASSVISSGSGAAFLRVTLRGPSSGSATVANVFIGYSSTSGDAYDFESSPIALTVGGSSNITLPVNTEVVCDDIPWTFLTARNLVLASFIVSGSIRYATSGSGYSSFNKTGSDAATVNATGYSSAQASVLFTKAEAVTAPSNITLRSVSYAAASVPASARLAVQTVETGAITINTDLIGKVSRDGGATWATAALSLSQSLSGVKTYEAGSISLASLGSGTSMKWEVDTANNKNVAISGVVLQWS